MRKKYYVIGGLLLLYISLIPLIINNYLKYYNKIINPIILFIIFLLCIIFSIQDKKKFYFKNEKIQSVLIISILYSVFYFFFGLVVGYGNSPYSHTIIGIIQNFFIYIMVVVYKEVIRAYLVNSAGKKYFNYFLILIIFVILDLNFYNFANNFISGEVIFKYFFNVIFISVIKNMLLIYLCLTGGYLLSLSCLLPSLIINFLMPILPDYNWFIATLMELLFILIIFFSVHKIHFRNQDKIYKNRDKKTSIFGFLVLCVLTIIMACFIIGVFKYVPIAIMSNSMSELIVRGDVVIVEKLEQNQIKNLKVNDIIEYRLNNSLIIHRIISIKNDGNKIYFITKGDNNKLPDSKIVKDDQVLGIVRIKIPKLGYPSVVLADFFNKTRPEVET